MNWNTFFLFLGVAMVAFSLPIALVPIMVWLDRKIGVYPSIVCLFVAAALVGATIAGMTQ